MVRAPALSWRGRRTRRRAVPGWGSRDLPWTEADLCVVDLETTGLDLRRDDIVSWGAVLVRGGRVQVGTAEYGLVRPEAEVSPAAARVHALTATDLASAPPVAQAAARLAELLEGRALVAHASWVEAAFLRRAFGGIGLRLDGPVIDTAAMAREAGVAPTGAGAPEPPLEELAERLGLPVYTPHHALGDAMTTAVLLLALGARLDARAADGATRTVRSLAELTRRPRG